jgi:hypothetical protein
LNETLRTNLDSLWSADRQLQNEAFFHVLELTEAPVKWAYEAWDMLVDGLERRFDECISEKNCTLIRYDILQSLRNLYDAVQDEGLRAKALEWIEREEDLKYRKKYAGLWRN